MRYLMLVCWDAEKMDALTEPSPSDKPEEESFPWLDDLQAQGKWVTGDQLAPPRRARSVRVRDGKTMVTDGPFAETKEAVGGFDIIECDSLEEAVEIAAGHPRRSDGDDRGAAPLAPDQGEARLANAPVVLPVPACLHPVGGHVELLRRLAERATRPAAAVPLALVVHRERMTGN